MADVSSPAIEWVRIADLATRPDAIDLTAKAMEEWAICKALILIHGPGRGTARYIEVGGSVRMDGDGEPVIAAPVLPKAPEAEPS